MSRFSPLRLFGTLVLLSIFVLPGATEAQQSRKSSLSAKAESFEKHSKWLEACRCYDDLLRKQPSNKAYREAYQRCLRRLQLVSRHSDRSYARTLANLRYDDSLTTYEHVLFYLNYAHAERDRAELASLVRFGLDEVTFALNDPTFQKHYLNGVKPAVRETFAHRVRTWPVERVTRPSDAVALVKAIIKQAGNDGLPTDGTLASALVMEFAAGACNGVDEHSCFLTPTHLALMQGPRARPASVGLMVKEAPFPKDERDGDVKARFQVKYIIHRNPSAKHDIQEDDWILKINGKDIKDQDESEVLKLLNPEAGKKVEVEWAPFRDKQDRRTATLESYAIPSVSGWIEAVPGGDPVAVIRINYFAEDTPHKLKEEIARLVNLQPFKGVILDLRGNPGGVLPASISVAELFLSGGIVSVSQGPIPDHNRPHKIETPGPYEYSMIVLVDGETASAAEVLAAALKEGQKNNPRALLMGQKTYGKGSVQRVILLKHAPLDKTAGIRLTVAKLFSPSNVAINGKGVTPERELLPDDKAMEEAKAALAELLNGMMTPSGKMMMSDEMS